MTASDQICLDAMEKGITRPVILNCPAHPRTVRQRCYRLRRVWRECGNRSFDCLKFRIDGRKLAIFNGTMHPGDPRLKLMRQFLDLEEGEPHR